MSHLIFEIQRQLDDDKDNYPSGILERIVNLKMIEIGKVGVGLLPVICVSTDYLLEIALMQHSPYPLDKHFLPEFITTNKLDESKHTSFHFCILYQRDASNHGGYLDCRSGLIILEDDWQIKARQYYGYLSVLFQMTNMRNARLLIYECKLSDGSLNYAHIGHISSSFANEPLLFIDGNEDEYDLNGCYWWSGTWDHLKHTGGMQWSDESLEDFDQRKQRHLECKIKEDKIYEAEKLLKQKNEMEIKQKQLVKLIHEIYATCEADSILLNIKNIPTKLPKVSTKNMEMSYPYKPKPPTWKLS